MRRQIILAPMCFGLAILMLAAGDAGNRCSAGTILVGDTVKLSTLDGNVEGRVVAGDKIFTNFHYMFTGDMPSAAGVNVTPIQDGAGNYGLRFQALFTDLASTQGGSDALITYDVGIDSAHLAQGYLISDAHLSGNTSSPDHKGFVGVTDTFLPLGVNGQYTMTIYDDEQKPLPKLADQTVFVPPVTTLHVQKDIGAYAIANFATPTLSFVDQTYSQTKIPEPTAVLLSLVGIVGLAIFMRQLDMRHQADA